MTHPPPNRDEGFIEGLIGWLGWPAAFVAAVIVAAMLYSSVDGGSNKAQLRKEIIAACSSAHDVPTCINNYKKNLP